jgi:MerR family transcriptional regulator, copper efflux regulator
MKPSAVNAATAPVARKAARKAVPRASRPASVAGNAPAAERLSKARTISVAAAEAGVHVETIRYYERLGLIPQPPRGRSYRHYPDAAVRALRFIRQAREFGFTLKEIEGLLALERRDAGCQDMCGQVELKVAELNRKIAALTALRDELSRLLKQSPRRGRHTECKVYECLSGGAAC